MCPPGDRDQLAQVFDRRFPHGRQGPSRGLWWELHAVVPSFGIEKPGPAIASGLCCWLAGSAELITKSLC